MRYVIVAVIKGEAGEFNNRLRKEVFQKFGARSSRLPAHFTIKAPFEYEGDIGSLEKTLEDFCGSEQSAPLELDGFGHFDDRVIYMRVNLSGEGKAMHDRLIDALKRLDYITFDRKDGKDKTFHVTVASKGLKDIFGRLWEYVNTLSCHFGSRFDNVSVFRWEGNTWVLHREYVLGSHRAH